MQAIYNINLVTTEEAQNGWKEGSYGMVWILDTI